MGVDGSYSPVECILLHRSRETEMRHMGPVGWSSDQGARLAHLITVASAGTRAPNMLTVEDMTDYVSILEGDPKARYTGEERKR